jgi:hypothetical protein
MEWSSYPFVEQRDGISLLVPDCLQLEAVAGTPLQLESAFQNEGVLSKWLHPSVLAHHLANFAGRIPPNIRAPEKGVSAFASR